jgi:hypothetical protein
MSETADPAEWGALRLERPAEEAVERPAALAGMMVPQPTCAQGVAGPVALVTGLPLGSQAAVGTLIKKHIVAAYGTVCFPKARDVPFHRRRALETLFLHGFVLKLARF